MVAIFIVFKMLYELFEEVQSLYFKLKLITPKYITWTYFDTKLSRFGLAGLPMVAILDLKMPLSHLFEYCLEYQSKTPNLSLGPIFKTEYDLLVINIYGL